VFWKRQEAFFNNLLVFASASLQTPMCGGIPLTGAFSRGLTDNSSLDFTFLHALAERPAVSNKQPQALDEYGVYPSRIQVNWSMVL
jgi:hypothetical protein